MANETSTGNQKIKHIRVYFDEDSYNKLIKASKKKQLSVSSFSRIAINDLVKVVLKEEEDSE